MRRALADRMKAFERAAAGRAFDGARPVYARIDGRGFSRLTDGLEKPFDARMSRAMEAAARLLVEETSARAGYVQSDEISLVWQDEGAARQLFFAGKPQKMVSVLAGLATAAFTQALLEEGGDMADRARRLPHFDARVCQMPSRAAAAEMFAWRGQDARRNAVMGVARSRFAHRALQGVGVPEMLARLRADGTELEDFPPNAVNGVLFRRASVLRPLDSASLERIPERHRPSPGQPVARRIVTGYCAAPPHCLANLSRVMFEGVLPREKQAVTR